MRAAALIQQAAADGVALALTASGTVKVSGDPAAVARWCDAIRDSKPGIVATLQSAGARFRWSVTRPGARSMEVRFCPEATLQQVAELYPGAICEPLPDTDAAPDAALDPREDRRTCGQCANLDRHRSRDGFRRCSAARRGELPYVASRDYSPVPDVPKRCEGLVPMAHDPDRRHGCERWPALNQSGGE